MGIVFLIAIFNALLGMYVGAKIIEHLDPKNSWTMNFLGFGVVATGGSVAGTDDRPYLAFVSGFS